MRVQILLVVAALLLGGGSATALGDPTDTVVTSGFTVKNKTTATQSSHSSGFTITNKCTPVVASQGETVCSPNGCQPQRGSPSFPSTYTGSSSESFSGDEGGWRPGKFLGRVRERFAQVRERIRGR